MVSKASDDFPEPDSPVNTMSRSRGSSTETLRRLCSRAPRTTRVSDIGAASLRPNRRSTGGRWRPLPGGAAAHLQELGLEVGDLVPEPGRVLESQLDGRL